MRDALTRRPFLKNVLIMLSGSAGGQLVSIILSPVLTRLYTPDQFGVLSVYSAILLILVVVASLRYELALPLARSDEDAINLMAVCFCALIVTTLLVGAAAVMFPVSLIDRFWPMPHNSFRLSSFPSLLTLGYFCLGGYFIALYVATQAGAFRPIAQTRVAQGVVGPLSQILLALLGAGTTGLLAGSIVGQSAGTFGLFYRVISSRLALLRTVSWRRMVEQAKRYRQFALIGVPAALIDAIGGNQLLYLLIAINYSTRIAGFIFLAERIVARPLALIGTSILQVFLGEAGQTVASEPEKLKHRFYQVVGRQCLLALGWILLANLAATALFPTVFGAEWEDGIVYLRAMSLAYLAQAIVLPVFHTLQILERQFLSAVWQLGRLVLSVAVFFVGTRLGLDAPWVITGYSAAQALSCLVLLLMIARSIQQVQR